jgi:hypothetical protein
VVRLLVEFVSKEPASLQAFKILVGRGGFEPPTNGSKAEIRRITY